MSCCSDYLCVRIATRTGECSNARFCTSSFFCHNAAVIAVCMTTGGGGSVFHIVKETLALILGNGIRGICSNVNNNYTVSGNRCGICTVDKNGITRTRGIKYQGKSAVGRSSKGN